MHAVVLGSVVTDIGDSLREAFFMFWETLWALILGFTLSGAVQAFVSRDEMQRTLPDHHARSVARASFFGMVSSSCSYAATAMARSLYEKGADFVAAMVFMFASTNLVLELGIVLAVLMGWQFMLAEFVGGPIMIVLLALTGGFVVGRVMATRTRARREPSTALEREPWGKKLRSASAWSDAAGYTMSDVKMLRRELVIGYVVAGFLAVVVPTEVWNNVFVEGHGFWTSLQNVVVGPLIACVSFVCSIGNVPMAAALWHGGISFGGVIAFIFADLIAMPLLLIYRKFYGRQVALRLFFWFWAVMAAAGLATEGIFWALGLIPSTRPETIVETHFQWNYTTFLNIFFLGVFAVLYWLHRNRERLGGGRDHATDPVCGMQVEVASAPARAQGPAGDVFFCSSHCRDRYLADPARFSGGATPSAAP